MSEQQSSYRQIIKATTIFGGVQVVNIIVQVVKSKLIAILLGPAGMGIVGLLNSTINLITGLSSCGLGTSAVKNIAAADSTGNNFLIARVVVVLRRLVWVTGSLGAILCIVLSKWLSILTFGTPDYTIAFIWVSCTLLFNQLTIGQMAVLQGLRKFKYLANASISGSILGLIFTIPIYYLWGIDGIVPAIIISSILSLVRSWYFSRKVKIEPVKVTFNRTLLESKQMIYLGFIISFSNLITIGASYIVRVFISNISGVVQVGLYTAGFAIISNYVSLILTSMGTDYFPRLSAVAKNNEQCKNMINKQGEVILLILAPILILFILLVNWAIIILYSSKFIDVRGLLLWAAIGMFFKASTWVVGFIFLAKGEGKKFFWNELIVNLYMLFLNIGGYYYLGLNGLGIAFLISYLIYFFQVYFVCRKYYKFKFEVGFIKIFLIQFILAFISFILVKHFYHSYLYYLGFLFFLVSSWYSYTELEKRIAIKDLIKKITKRGL